MYTRGSCRSLNSSDSSPTVSDSIEKNLQQQVLEANRSAHSLNITGGSSKSFYGREAVGTPINTGAHKGVVHYDPSELVITVRTGTRVTDLEELLALKNQMLGFEPPRFSSTSTIGGAVAAGLAGPRRPYAGAVRDFVLGVKVLTGKGEIMRFGGQVMKNVAGFDIARLMAGAMGTLGILLEVSLRIIPQPQTEKTLVLEQPNPIEAIAMMNRLAGRPLPLSAAAWQDGETRIRLSGSVVGVDSAARVIGGEVDSLGHKYWQQLRDQELSFFRSTRPLLRVSLPAAAELRSLDVPQLIDWGGAHRWITSDIDIDSMRKIVAGHGGFVTGFRHVDRGGAVFQPLEPVVQVLHARLKHAFDPSGVLNPGRMYRDW